MGSTVEEPEIETAPDDVRVGHRGVGVGRLVGVVVAAGGGGQQEGGGQGGQAGPADSGVHCDVVSSEGSRDGPTEGHAAQGTEGRWPAPVAQVTPG